MYMDNNGVLYILIIISIIITYMIVSLKLYFMTIETDYEAKTKIGRVILNVIPNIMAIPSFILLIIILSLLYPIMLFIHFLIGLSKRK